MTFRLIPAGGVAVRAKAHGEWSFWRREQQKAVYLSLSKKCGVKMRLLYKRTRPVPTLLLVGCGHWGNIKLLAVELLERVFLDSGLKDIFP